MNDDINNLRNRYHDLFTYLKYLFVIGLIIGIIVIIQLGFVLKVYKPQYLVVPIILAITLGFLFGHVSILRKRLLRNAILFRGVADFAQEFTYFRNIEGHYEYISPSCVDLTGYHASDFYNTPNFMDSIIHEDDLESWREHIHKINNAGNPESLDLRLITKSGDTIWFSHMCGPVFDNNGKQVGVRSANININERKNIEQRIEHMAYYDSLTDLPNRRALTRFIDKLTQNVSASNEKFALLFLDLDRFKNINDSFHHEFGDHLLTKLANRLQHCCEDRGYVTRFGGDEFVVVVPQLGKPSAAIDYAQKMIDTIEQPLIVNEKEFYISGGIGIALYPYDGQDAATLIRNADAAMYKAKKEAHNCISLYSSELIDDATSFMTTENRIRQGLNNCEFIPYFQPKVDITNGDIIGAEALARWETQDKAIILPDDFIYIAEETGLIIPLGSHMLESTCKQIHKWSSQGIKLPVAINISPKQFAHPRFIDTIKEVVEKYDIDPGLLELELTEQAFLNDMNSAIDMLWKLKDLGLSIAVDDFGTGYSSLSYIKRLPIDTLKVDKSFTKEILEDVRDVAILRAILSLCHDLKLSTVIEGIETQEQANLLEKLGCKEAQGFLYYKAMPAVELTAIIRK